MSGITIQDGMINLGGPNGITVPMDFMSSSDSYYPPNKTSQPSPLPELPYFEGDFGNHHHHTHHHYHHRGRHGGPGGHPTPPWFGPGGNPDYQPVPGPDGELWGTPIQQEILATTYLVQDQTVANKAAIDALQARFDEQFPPPAADSAAFTDDVIVIDILPDSPTTLDSQPSLDTGFDDRMEPVTPDTGIQGPSPEEEALLAFTLLLMLDELDAA